MCSRPMIIGDIRDQETSQMPLAHDDHVVQTLAPDGSDQSLCIRILPGAGRTRDHLADAHAGDPAPEQLAVDGRRDPATAIAAPCRPGMRQSSVAPSTPPWDVP